MVQGFEAPSRVAPTIAQQIFVIGSGIAGGAAGLALAKGLAKVKEVPTSLVVGATIVSVIFTLGAGIYIAEKAKEGFV
jgi:heterodisulfide reductase subunit A-like polyferredoxin